MTEIGNGGRESETKGRKYRRKGRDGEKGREREKGINKKCLVSKE